MDITSVTFLLFVAASLIIYWQLPSKYQWWVLLADSLIFYFLNAKAYTFVYLLASVVSVYFATMFFEKEENIKSKRIVLTGTLIINIGILAVLKYTNLLLKTMNFIGGGKRNHRVGFLVSFSGSQLLYLADCGIFIGRILGSDLQGKKYFKTAVIYRLFSAYDIRPDQYA